MLELSTIVARGVARYQASLPEYDTELMALVPRADVEPEPNVSAELETTPNVSAVDEDTQRRLCLSCPLSDCLDVTDERCPIRIEMRRRWRERN